MDTQVRMTLRLPLWAAQFLDRMGEENFTSRNAEIIRSVKERMEATQSPTSREVQAETEAL